MAGTFSLLFMGRFSDIIRKVKVHNIGFAIFTVSSLFTSLSTFPISPILAPIFQGLGSAGLFSNSTAIVADALPRGELDQALGIDSVAYRAGSLFGLTLSRLVIAFLHLGVSSLLIAEGRLISREGTQKHG